MTSALASFTRLSPSMMTISRRGTPSRLAMALAATGSVGETIAPSTTADAHGRPATWCMTTATTAVVAMTRPIASRPIGRRFARRSRSDVKKADEYSSGGSSASSTMSGGSASVGTPGIRARPSPPSTSRIGYGTRSTGSSASRPPMAARIPSSTIRSWLEIESCTKRKS